MLKIVVFDGGWGGEMVAKYLETELGIVQVVRVLDWSNLPYYNKTAEELAQIVEREVMRFINKVDAIVLGGYALNGVAKLLRERYPGQKFVEMGVDYRKLLRTRSELKKVVVLTGSGMMGSSLFYEMKRKLTKADLFLSDCDHWEQLINENRLEIGLVRAELEQNFALVKGFKKKPVKKKVNNLPLKEILKLERMESDEPHGDIARAIRRLDKVSRDKLSEEKREIERMPVLQNDREKVSVDAVLLMNTHFWEIKAGIEELFGWKVRVLDFREKLLRDVCIALKLQGVDGDRPK